MSVLYFAHCEPPFSGRSPVTRFFWMLPGSRTHAHQSEFGSFGAPGPMSPWKPAVATPQRKFLGSFGAAAAGLAETAATRRARMQTTRAIRGIYVLRGPTSEVRAQYGPQLHSDRIDREDRRRIRG